MFRKKTVCLQIEVPEEDWCSHIKKMIVCHYFDNHRSPQCNLHLDDYNLAYDEDGNVPKPPRCRQLECCSK